MDLSLKRIIGYILDIILVTLVATALSNIKQINPYMDKFNETYEEYEKVVEEYKKIDTSDESENAVAKAKEYENRIIDINYKIYKYKTVSNTISIVCLLLYFGLFEFLANGQTLGQKAMKLKIVKKDSMERSKVWNYGIRIIVLNNIVFTIIAMILVFVLKAKPFYYAASTISLIQNGILLLNIIMVVMRNDHRGLHDMLSNTVVIGSNDVIEEDDLVEETKKSKTSIKEKVEKKETRQKKKDMV